MGTGPLIYKRADGRTEQVCEHGVGHTVDIPEQFKNLENAQAWYAHGCDGCCMLPEDEQHA